MPRLPTDPEPSPLLHHLEALYPLACILAGPDDADSLLLRVYERAAKQSPEAPSEDRRRWLLGLLLELHEEPATAPNLPEESEAGDPLRRDTVRQAAKDALPLAFAACPQQERVLLTLDVLGESDTFDESALASALDTTATDAQARRSDAWTTLRAHLRETLPRPARPLLEEALPDDALRESLRTLIEDRFAPVPSSLRAQIRTALQSTDRPDESEGEPSSPPETPSSGSDRFSVRTRTLLIGLLILAVGIAGLVALFPFSSSPPSSASAPSGPNLVAFSAQRAPSVSPRLTTKSPSKATAYVESTWDRQVPVPEVRGATLRGVGQLRAAGSVEVPVFLYNNTNPKARVAIFAYSYALVDRLGTAATLSTSIRDSLAPSKHLVSHESDGRGGLLWRNRDDIFVAVSPTLPPDSLRGRLNP